MVKRETKIGEAEITTAKKNTVLMKVLNCYKMVKSVRKVVNLCLLIANVLKKSNLKT